MFGPSRVAISWERVAQDRIVLERFADYWDKGKVFIDQVVFKIIIDPSVRLANLKAGELDLFERVRPTDLNDVRKDPNVVLSSIVGLGYQGITINIANSDGLGKPPKPVSTLLARDARVREALELSLDRKVLNDVINNGEFVPACLPIPPVSTFYPKAIKCVARCRQGKQLLAQAGVLRLREVYADDHQRRMRSAGKSSRRWPPKPFRYHAFNPVEFATALNLQDAGKPRPFDWLSGRIDPDGNIYNFHTCGAAECYERAIPPSMTSLSRRRCG
jgi:peptide/nickel transport system substrate-binding protein